MPLSTAQTYQLFRNSGNTQTKLILSHENGSLNTNCWCPVLKSKSKTGKGGMGGRWAYSRAMPSRGQGSLPACSQAQAPVSHSAPSIFTILRCTCHFQVCSDQVPQIPGSRARQTGTPGSGHIPPTSTPTWDSRNTPGRKRAPLGPTPIPLGTASIRPCPGAAGQALMALRAEEWHRLERRAAVLLAADTYSIRGESGHPPTRPKPQEGPSSGSGSMGGVAVEHRNPRGGGSRLNGQGG